MTLDKFINSVRSEVAKRFDLKTDAEIDAFFIGMEESAKDNQEALEKRDKMLRDTVAELCEAKRLLKAAVDAIYELLDCGAACSGKFCDKYCIYNCETCPLNEENGTNECGEWRKWKHADEALKLIGATNDEP